MTETLEHVEEFASVKSLEVVYDKNPSSGVSLGADGCLLVVGGGRAGGLDGAGWG